MTCTCCEHRLLLPSRQNRRDVLRSFGAALAASAVPACAWADAAHKPKTSLTPDMALAMLMKGNDEYLRDQPFHGMLDRQRRIAIAREQHPIAVLISCSDSRVPPELLFGRGLGELFIVRNAGNTVDTTALGSVEYAIEHLGVPLVIVLGHERCGAVQAAVSVVKDGARFNGALGQMIEPIIPAVLEAQGEALQGKAPQGKDWDLLDQSVRANVRRVVERLKRSGPTLSDPLSRGTLKIIGARYDLDDGDVDFGVA